MNIVNSLVAYLPEPAVSRPILLISAGVFWLMGASVLFYRGYEMLTGEGEMLILLVGLGLVVGGLKYRMVLSRTVKKNAERIREMAPHKDRVCIFAFQSLQSYLLVMGMMGFGFGLRAMLDFPRILGTLYFAIGAALILGAVQYFRAARQY